MRQTSGILHFAEMNDLYQHIGLSVRTDHPALHIYKFSDFDEHCLRAMPPHTKDFHQASFITNFGSSQQHFNQRLVEDISSAFYFVSPQHVYSWRRDANISGYILNFRADSLPLPPTAFYRKFRFFHLNEPNTLMVGAKEERRVVEIFDDIYNEYYQSRGSISVEMLRQYVLVLLYKCLSLYEQREASNHFSVQEQLFSRYQHLINNYYLSKRTVAQYADLLHITPDHLNDTVKKAGGRPAKWYIDERLLTEAKNLLTFSDMDVKEIGYMLHFSSPSHFGRFFKKHTAYTPLQYRKTTIPSK